MVRESSPILARVLVVDDEEQIRKLLEGTLKAFGYEVKTAESEEEMREILETYTPDIVLVDLKFGEDRGKGLEIIRGLRSESDVPIIMLTSEGTDEDLPGAVGIGADDFLRKPPQWPVLVSKMNAILRRTGKSQIKREVAHFNGWTLEFGSRDIVSPTGAKINLTSAEYKILAKLLRAGDRTVTRDALVETLKSKSTKTDNINYHVSMLREKLGDDSRSPQIINTVYGDGYSIACKVDIGPL